MTASKRFFVSIVFLLSFGIGLSGSALGQDNTTKDLNNFLCKDIMRMSGDDRDVVIGMLHGFILGKKGTTKLDIQKLGDATDRFIEYSLDHPGEKALDVMMNMTK